MRHQFDNNLDNVDRMIDRTHKFAFVGVIVSFLASLFISLTVLGGIGFIIYCILVHNGVDVTPWN